MSEKKLWNIFHCYGTDGGFGDYIPQEDHVGTVEATEEEIKEFLEKWDKPEVYEKPYAELDCHAVRAVPVEVVELKGFEPYSTDPEDWFNRRIREMKERASK